MKLFNQYFCCKDWKGLFLKKSLLSGFNFCIESSKHKFCRFDLLLIFVCKCAFVLWVILKHYYKIEIIHDDFIQFLIKLLHVQCTLILNNYRTEKKYGILKLSIILFSETIHKSLNAWKQKKVKRIKGFQTPRIEFGWSVMDRLCNKLSGFYLIYTSSK